MATQPITGLTYDDLAAFPDDNLRRELIDGELIVTASPSRDHQRAVMVIAAAFFAWCKEHGGEVYPAPLDVFLSPNTILEPDVLFVGPSHPKQAEDRYVEGPPDIAVEVSSPSTRRLEIVRKREVYERFGVPEYWYVDRQADRIELYLLTQVGYGAPRILYRGEVITTPLAPGLEIPVEEILGEPSDEDD